MAANWLHAVTNSPVIQRTLQAAHLVSQPAALPEPAQKGTQEASEASDPEGRKDKPVAFKTLKAVQLPPKAPMRPAWAEPVLAMQDVMFSAGRPVIIKSCPKATYHLLKNSLFNMRSNLVLRMNFPADISPKDLKARLLAFGEEIAQLPAEVPVTLQVFWNAETAGAQTISLATLLGGGKSPLGAKDDDSDDEDGDGSDNEGEGGGGEGKAGMEQGILVLQEVLHKVHPKSKMVVFTPAPALHGAKAQKACEIYDANSLGYKLDKDGFEHKVGKLHHEYRMQAPLDTALRAVRGIAYKDLGSVFRDATLISSRHATLGSKQEPGQAPELTSPQLLHVLMAGERLRNRAAGNTEDACKHLTRVPREEAALLGEVPTAVGSFCDLLRNFDRVHALAPQVSRGLLLEGDKELGKESVARAIAASVGDGFLFSPDRTELLAMVASGKGKGLSKFLTEVNTFAHQQKCRGVVYLADLAELLNTVDRVSEQGLLVRGLLAKLLGGFGTEANRDRLVLVAAARDAEALGDELALRFGARAFIKPAGAAQRLQLWRSELTAASNAALSDDALHKQVLPECSSFARSDVQQAIALAAQHAVVRAEGGTPELTAEDLLVGIRAHAHTRREPDWRRAYS